MSVTITPTEISDQRWCRVKPGRKDGEFIAVILEGEDAGKVVLPNTQDEFVPPAELQGNVFIRVGIIDAHERYCFGHRAAQHYRRCVGTHSSVSSGKRLPFFPSTTLEEAKVACGKHVQQELASQEKLETARLDLLARETAAMAAVAAEAEAAGPHGEELYAMLSTHDWYYDYSDDGQVWRQGDNAYKHIVAFITTMDATVARKVWGLVAPKEFSFPC